MRLSFIIFLSLISCSALFGQDICYLVVNTNNSAEISKGMYKIKSVPKQFKDTYSSYKNNLEVIRQGLVVWVVQPDGMARAYNINEEELKNLGECEPIISDRFYFTNLTHLNYLKKVDSLTSSDTHYLPEQNGINESISYTIRFRYVFSGNLDSSNHQVRISALNEEKIEIRKQIKGLMVAIDKSSNDLHKVQGLQKEMNAIADEMTLLNMYPELSKWSYEKIIEEKKMIDSRLLSKIRRKNFWRNNIENYQIWHDKNSSIFSFRCNESNLNLVQKYEQKISRMASINLLAIEKVLIENFTITYW